MTALSPEVPTNLLARNRSKPGAAEVFDVLRDEIIGLKLPPGTALQRADLQTRFAVSSTPVRDALMRLAEEGLVVIFPQHATLVSHIDLAAAERAQFLRKAVEIEVVRTLALDPAKAPIAALRALIAQKQSFAEADDHGAFMQADAAFHRAMFEAAGVDGLWWIIRKGSGHIDRLRRLHLPMQGKMREIIRFHGDIADAIAAGKVGDAQAAMREHLSRSLLFAGALRDQHPGYFQQ
jgi:GntR family transcriptional regulator, rspAB operon transcriptional repressor